MPNQVGVAPELQPNSPLLLLPQLPGSRYISELIPHLTHIENALLLLHSLTRPRIVKERWAVVEKGNLIEINNRIFQAKVIILCPFK